MSTVLKVVGASWLQTKISSYILGLLGVLAILALFVGQIERIQEDGNYAATVFYSEKTGYRIEYWGQSNELADIPRGVARAHFRMDVDTTGWSLLEVETNASYSDEIQAYAAGVVEGALTWYLLHNHLKNTIKAKCDDTPLEKQCNKLKDHLDKSVDIWKKYASEHENEPFWHQVSLYYTQINGIFTGWKHGVERSQNEYETDISDLFWLNSVAEVAELQRKLNISIENSTLDNLPDLSTAFLRVVNETTEEGVVKKMFVSQNAVGSYNSMTRILKRYKLNYHLSDSSPDFVTGTTVEFSGYPGSITSQDEFYVIKGQEHKMAVTGTALRNYNNQLWNEVNITEQVPVGPRITSANRLAVNVSSWAHVLASHNSGTGSKQWLITDFVRLDHLHRNDTAKPVRSEVVTERTINQHVRHTVVHRASRGHTKGLVMLVEQVPGLTHSADLSDAVLEQGYWATYGLPFFKDVAETTHVNHMEQTFGAIFSELESPRAVLFKQGYKNATTLDSIINLMRQNNITAIKRAYNDDKNCNNDVDCAIAEMGYWSVLGVRGDILEAKEAYGVVDTKIFSGTQNSSITEFAAISAPPYTKVVQSNITLLLNKGNIAPIYTEQFNDKPDINGLEARDLVKHRQEEAEQETLQLLNRDVIKPFQWSESSFARNSHVGLPDKWEFGPFRPIWSW